MELAETVLAKSGGVARAAAPRCTRLRVPRHGARCSTCADLCPAGAIALTDAGPVVDSACNGCGTCLSACRTGAFAATGDSDERLIASVRGHARPKELQISCEKGDATAEMVLPCLGRLTEGLLLGVIRMRHPVRIMRPDCSACPNGRVAPHIDGTLSCTLSLLRMLGIPPGALALQDAPLRASAPGHGRTVSRRELFSTVRKRVAAAVGDAGEATPRLRAMSPQRMALLEQLAGVAAVDEVRVPSSGSLVAEPEVSSRCTACGTCAALCPTGALSAVLAAESFSLRLTPALCANCGVCKQVCRPGAVAIRDESRLNALLETEPRALFMTRTRVCRACRAPFALDEEQSGFCSGCRDRMDKQASFIRKGLVTS